MQDSHGCCNPTPPPPLCVFRLAHRDSRLTLTSEDQDTSGWGKRWLEGPVVETLPDFLDLSRELLVTQWHCFQPAVVRAKLFRASRAFTLQHLC